MEDINIKELFYIILKRWWIILIAFVVAAAAAAIYSFFIVDPVYQSSTTIYIGKNAENTNATIAYNDILLNDRLVKDYRELIISRKVTEMVIKELGLSDVTSGSIASRISVSSKQDTRFIQISVDDVDPELAKDIANKIAEVFKQQVVEIMEVENVQIIDPAILPESPVKPNKKMNLAIASLIGIMLGAGIIFLVEYLDNTVKTPDDVKKHTGLPVIGTIPVFPVQSNK